MKSRDHTVPSPISPWFRPYWTPTVSSVGFRVGCNMFSIRCASSWYGRNYPNMPLASAAAIRNVMQRLAVVLAAASLAACAQSPVATNKSEILTPSRQTSREHNRTISIATNKPVTAAKKHTPFASDHKPAEPKSSHGIASFYTEGAQTASGEKFNTHELTAAHPTLPFGTRLRVTNVGSGQSVTVRVNDRGPYTPGRVVDVSYAAAEKLGMVGRGVAKVKLDVVH
jgi:rare lipoprotein A